MTEYADYHEIGPMRKIRIHDKANCEEPCPFHSPSKHKMRKWPKLIRASGLVERTCEHGVGHPDPDSVAYLDKIGMTGYAIHGCDGCCCE